jgi:ankyrin repeat protein
MRSTTLTLVVSLLAAPLFAAAETSVSDQFYDAIRRDDTAAVQKLLASGADVNLKDSRGGTPLMYATASGSEAMMRRLLDAKADVNAKNAFDATALHFCMNSAPRVKLLVDHGADVNVVSKLGHTPIELAASHAGGLEIVKLLLAKGAKFPVPPDQSGQTPVSAAAWANDTAMIRFFVERYGKEALAGPAGPMALITAASFGNTEIVKLLLAQGVPPNVQSPPETERVKNGPILIGSLSPLMLAAPDGNTETVRALLDAGADVNARDVRGMTPLMFAVATDHPNHDIIRMILARKPDLSIHSKTGETAYDWAQKIHDPSVIALLPAPATASAASTNGATGGRTDAPELRAALEKSVGLLQTSGVKTFRDGGCVSCHGGNAITSAVAAARRAGIHTDDAAAAESLKATRLQFAPRAEGLLERNDGPALLILTYALNALADENAPGDRTTDAMVHNVAAQQLADGLWSFRGVMRPPTADSVFSNAAFAIRAMKQYAPPARRAEYDERVARAVKAISAAEPTTTDDAVMQLLALKWGGGDAAKLATLSRRLAAKQREDGGWSQTAHMGSDAYATGTALYALHQTGMDATAPEYKKGVAFLLKSQAADGSWHVAGRAPKFQPYFDGGFPYQHDQWISQWGTAWATMALSEAVPQTRAAR